MRDEHPDRGRARIAGQHKAARQGGLGRRGFACAALAALARPSVAAAASYPARPVSVVIPFPAGGSTHTIGRLLCDRLGRAFGQPFLVTNRAGLGGTVGSAAVARAAPDGHTLLVSPNSTFAMAAQLYPLPYDNERAFAPISLLAANALALCVHAASGLRDMDDLIAAARAAPGRIGYGSAGVGTSNHLAAELMADGFDIQLSHQDFRGGGAAVQALIADRVQLSFVDLVTAIPLIRGGAIRALAVTAPERVRQLPNVPALSELGLPGYSATTDFAFLAPAGTPEEILGRIAETTMGLMRSDEIRDRLEPLAVTPIGSTPSELAAHMQSEIRRWRAVIEANGISVP
jgi:tripartite-type tricarboxylate transporter receptor subunit TctC